MNWNSAAEIEASSVAEWQRVTAVAVVAAAVASAATCLGSVGQ